MCIRISGIPPEWDRQWLEEKLQTIDPEFDRGRAEIFGPFPDSYEPTQTALLNLNQCTAYTAFEPNEEKHEVLYENSRRIRLRIDEHFHDLTPLNRAEVPINMESVYLQKVIYLVLTCVHSVVAITGLGGHAFGSWLGRTTKPPIDRPMWLRDFLPQRFPNARIMTYGYDSSLKESSGANITDYRRGFIQCLRNSRRQCPVGLRLTRITLRVCLPFFYAI